MSSQNVVPSIATYLNDFDASVKAVVIGFTGPFVMYIVWEAVILGVVTSEKHTESLTPAIMFIMLSEQAGPFITYAVQIFSFLAIVTSILGVGLGTLDFFHEGLYNVGTSVDGPLNGSLPAKLANSNQQSDTRDEAYMMQRKVAAAATFLPPLIFAITMPNAFLPALEFSVTSRLLLFGFFPVAMSYETRKKHDNLDGKNRLRGGTTGLIVVAIITMSLLINDWFHLTESGTGHTENHQHHHTHTIHF